MSTTRPRVLVVEDEPQILQALRILLTGAGYAVEQAQSASAARAAVAALPPDLVLLDLVLPDGHGVELCRELRQASDLPVVVLSAIGDEREKVRALDAGADDYVTKPFGADELLARLRAALRRAPEAATGAVVEVGELRIDLADQRVTRAGEPVRLTPIEFALVRALASRRGRLVTHRQLLREVWGPEYTQETHYLRVHFTNVRAKLEPDPARPVYVITEPGTGYRLGEPASDS